MLSFLPVGHWHGVEDEDCSVWIEHIDNLQEKAGRSLAPDQPFSIVDLPRIRSPRLPHDVLRIRRENLVLLALCDVPPNPPELEHLLSIYLIRGRRQASASSASMIASWCGVCGR